MNAEKFNGQIILNQSLADYTTWRVGGVARQMYKPHGIDDLANFLRQQPATENFLWLGLGSNSLIKDHGFSGTVILTQGALNEISVITDNTIRVEAGVSCAQMARFCARANLVGGEFWAGIPGTMGGALRMNAGCFDSETWNHVIEVETITRSGEIRRRSSSEFEISYRHVVGLEKDEWFVAATCKLASGNKDQSLEKIKTLLARRAATQPTNEYNCGSVFRNPQKMYAAQLIESCGLKGKKLGGAMVSEKHANFIINHQGQALAEDIEKLILFVQNTVYQNTGIELHREVHILGD
jgi:UDP-N-acetylmuramate dehydrogenase